MGTGLRNHTWVPNSIMSRVGWGGQALQRLHAPGFGMQLNADLHAARHKAAEQQKSEHKALQ